MPCPYAAQFHDVAADFHAELLEQQLAHRAARHARHGLPRARALQDVPSVLERASARETVARVACGAVCKLLLEQFGMEIGSHVVELGGITAKHISLLP